MAPDQPAVLVQGLQPIFMLTAADLAHLCRCRSAFRRSVLNLHKLSISLFLLMCPTLASAQGCTVAGNNGDLQMKSGTGCAASLVNDNGTVLSVGEDIKIKGPNPYVDIRAYGAKAVANVNIPPALASTFLPIS